jgi:hypothetical protein
MRVSLTHGAGSRRTCGSSDAATVEIGQYQQFPSTLVVKNSRGFNLSAGMAL